MVFGPPGGKSSAYTATISAGGARRTSPWRRRDARVTGDATCSRSWGRTSPLLAFDAAADAARIEAAAQARKVPLKVVQDTQAGEPAEYGRKLILVRPDQFIAWTADEAPEDVDALMRKVAGQ